jgi:CBS domain
MDVPSGIRRIAKRLNHGHRVYRITVRNFLGHFGAERRGAVKVEEIEKILNSLGLETEPNFRNAWIDEPIRLCLKGNISPVDGMLPSTDTPDDLEDEESDETVLENSASAVGAEVAPTSAEPNVLEFSDEGMSYDPIFRIGSLPAANKIPVVVGQDDTLTRAITMMLQHDFSQLPVMQGEREVKGMITWKSICSRLLLSSMGSQSTPECRVRDYREDAKIVEGHLEK